MATFDYRDPSTQQYVKLDLTGPPIGSIVAYNSASAPAAGVSEWHLCNGGAISRTAYPVLFALIGTTFGAGDGSTTFNVPNLVDRFLLGWGTRAIAATGGAASVLLTAAQSGHPAHYHTASTGGASADHAHSYTSDTEPNHVHSRGYMSNYIRYTNLSNDTSPDDILVQNPYDNASEAAAGGHTHGGNTGWINNGGADPHVHAITVNNNVATNASSYHENRPPYYALTFIIRKA